MTTSASLSGLRGKTCLDSCFQEAGNPFSFFLNKNSSISNKLAFSQVKSFDEWDLAVGSYLVVIDNNKGQWQ